MDTLKYLEDDNHSIIQRLTDTINNYSEWTQERVFEEAKKAFASIHQHFVYESIVENNLKNSIGIQRIMSQADSLKNEITSELEQIVELHIDEPGFEQSLEIIAQKYRAYADLCKEQFYPSLKTIISADELNHINDQIEQKVF